MENNNYLLEDEFDPADIAMMFDVASNTSGEIKPDLELDEDKIFASAASEVSPLTSFPESLMPSSVEESDADKIAEAVTYEFYFPFEIDEETDIVESFGD